MSRASWLELTALAARVLRATDARYARSPEKVGELAGCAPDMALSTLRWLRVRELAEDDGERPQRWLRTHRGDVALEHGAVSEALRQAIGARLAVCSGEPVPAVRAPARRPRCVSGEICRVRQPDYAVLIPRLARAAGHAGSHAALIADRAAAFPTDQVDRRLAVRHN